MDPQADQAAFSKAYDAQRAQEQEQQQPKPEPSFVERYTSIGKATLAQLDQAMRWQFTQVGRATQDVGSGLATAAINTTHAAASALETTGKSMAAAEDPEHADAALAGPDLFTGTKVWQHAERTALDFRDAIAVQDPTLGDRLLQAGAQLAIPFMGYSKMLAGINGFAKIAAAGVATDMTVLAPHDRRLADVISMARTTDGRLGEILRAIAPNDSGLNAYITYLGDRSDESEAEGRLKNALDGFGTNLIMTPLLAGVASALKQGRSAIGSLLENGVTKSSDLLPPQPPRPPLVQSDADPLEAAAAEQARKDADAAAAAGPDAKRPPLVQGGVGQADPMETLAAQQARADAERAAQATMKANALKAGAPGEREAALQDLSPGTKTTAGASEDPVESVRATIERVNTGGGGDHPLSDLVGHLADNLDASTPEGAFYKDVFGLLRDQHLETKVVPASEGGHGKLLNTRGSYSPLADTLAVQARGMRDPQMTLHTLAHESMHAATQAAIARSPLVRRAIGSIATEFIQSDAFKALSRQDKYGAKINEAGEWNPKEFVAEAHANPRFQQALRDTKTASGASLWDEYKDVVGNILKPGAAAALVASPLFDKLLSGEEKPGA